MTGAVAEALSRPAMPASLYICDDSILAACRTTQLVLAQAMKILSPPARSAGLNAVPGTPGLALRDPSKQTFPFPARSATAQSLENTPRLAPGCALAPQHLGKYTCTAMHDPGRKRAQCAPKRRSGRKAQPPGLQQGALIRTATHALGFLRPAVQQAARAATRAQSQGLP